MEQLTIMYDGIEFTVWGYYYKGSLGKDYFEPNEPAEFDIREVYNGNDNIMDLLQEYVVNGLSYLALESILNR